MEVSVRELKANLSAVLREVEAGNTAVITVHRKRVAKLSRLPSGGDSLDDRLMAAGLMSQRPEPGPLLQAEPVPLPKGVGSLSDAVLEDRVW